MHNGSPILQPEFHAAFHRCKYGYFGEFLFSVMHGRNAADTKLLRELVIRQRSVSILADLYRFDRCLDSLDSCRTYAASSSLSSHPASTNVIKCLLCAHSDLNIDIIFQYFGIGNNLQREDPSPR